MGRRAVVDDTPPLHSNEAAKDKFLDGIRDGLTLTEAAARAGYSRRSFFDLRRDDPEFAAAFADAYGEGTDVWERELRRRALEGVEEVIVDKNGNEHTTTRYSDTLLIFGLKKRDPSYRDNHRVEITGDGGGPVKVEQRGVSVVGVLRVLAEVGALDGIPGVDAGSLRALPAAETVLPAQPD